MSDDIKIYIQEDGGIDGNDPNDGSDEWFHGLLNYAAGDERVTLDGEFTAKQLRDIADQIDKSRSA